MEMQGADCTAQHICPKHIRLRIGFYIVRTPPRAGDRHVIVTGRS